MSRFGIIVIPVVLLVGNSLAIENINQENVTNCLLQNTSCTKSINNTFTSINADIIIRGKGVNCNIRAACTQGPKPLPIPWMIAVCPAPFKLESGLYSIPVNFKMSEPDKTSTAKAKLTSNSDCYTKSNDTFKANLIVPAKNLYEALHSEFEYKLSGKQPYYKLILQFK